MTDLSITLTADAFIDAYLALIANGLQFVFGYTNDDRNTLCIIFNTEADLIAAKIII